MVLDYRLGKINSLLSQRHQYRLWITARKLSVISAANSASVKIFASSYSFNVHLSYMKQNRSLFDEEKKKKKRTKGNFRQRHSISQNNKHPHFCKQWPFTQKLRGFFLWGCFVVCFFFPRGKIHAHTYTPTHIPTPNPFLSV